MGNSGKNRAKSILLFVLVLAVAAGTQTTKKQKNSQPVAGSAASAAEDISGMYSFLKEGEFVQINLDQGVVSGYISREGQLDSDQGQFLDQFFSKASIQGHDVSFTTKPVHGVWFEFKGRFDRGPADSKMKDGYYVLRGTLTEFTSDAINNISSKSREVMFQWLAQPEDKI